MSITISTSLDNYNTKRTECLLAYSPLKSGTSVDCGKVFIIH